MRILVDECLSIHLVAAAQEAGFEAYHVAHRGLSGKKDAHILEHLIEQNFVLVTNNRDDFLDLVEGVELHPGLIGSFRTFGAPNRFASSTKLYP